MAIYDINGSELVSAATVQRVSRNNEEFVTEFLSVAQSYLEQEDIEYSDGNTIFWKSTASNGIDCSTFVGLCMMGYPYAKSPYATHQYKAIDAWEANTADYKWALPTVRYKISRYADGSNPNENIRLGSQLCRWMEERGQSVPLSNGFRDVMPGDIVFWAAKYSSTGEWVNPTFYRNISHVGIVLTKEAAPNTYVDGNGNTRQWDKAKYPYKHTIIEVTNVDPPCIMSRWLERRQEDASYMWDSNVNTIAMICRPDFGALSPSAT